MSLGWFLRLEHVENVGRNACALLTTNGPPGSSCRHREFFDRAARLRCRVLIRALTNFVRWENPLIGREITRAIPVGWIRMMLT